MIETVFWLRSDDFKKRTAELKRRNNEPPAEKQKRLQQLARHDAENKAILSQSGSPQPTAMSGTGSGTGSIAQITIPIWFREREREYFKETDPEWQSFLHFQQDQKKVMEVYMKLYKTVARQLHSPRHAPQLQYINFKHSMGANFELVIPIFKPITYEVPCISVTSDRNLALGWLALPPAGSAKIERMFHPVVFSHAFLAGVKAFSSTTFYITKAKISDQYNGAEPSKMSVSMVHMGNRKIVTNLTIQKGLSREQQIVTQLPMNRIPEKHAKLNLPFLRGEAAAGSTMKKNYRDVVSSTTYSDAIEHASLVFKQTWLDKHMAAVQDTTNGVLIIKGFLDCFGEHGTYRLEVAAFYLPSEDAFVGEPQITNAFIMPDLTGTQMKKRMQAARQAHAHLHHGNHGHHENHGHPDKTPPVHQPPPPAEKPTPNKDAGK